MPFLTPWPGTQLVRAVAVAGIEKGEDRTRELALSCTFESEVEGPSGHVDIWPGPDLPSGAWMGPEEGLSSPRQDSAWALLSPERTERIMTYRVFTESNPYLNFVLHFPKANHNSSIKVTLFPQDHQETNTL